MSEDDSRHDTADSAERSADKPRRSWLEIPIAEWDRVMAVNVRGVFLGCKYAIPAMLRSGGGSIVNTASFVALMGAATPQIAYTASKGGVLSMTREIAVEYAMLRGSGTNASRYADRLASMIAEQAAKRSVDLQRPLRQSWQTTRLETGSGIQQGYTRNSPGYCR